MIRRGLIRLIVFVLHMDGRRRYYFGRRDSAPAVSGSVTQGGVVKRRGKTATRLLARRAYIRASFWALRRGIA